MKRAAWLVPLIGLAVLFLSGCGNNEINLTLSQSGKIVLYPNPGDVINWKGGVSVHFYGTPLCTDTSSKFLTTCTVAKPQNANAAGQYYYVCDPQHVCSDPEVDMGSGSSIKGQSVTASVANDGVAVPCTNGTFQPSPTPLPDDIQTAPLVPGSMVQWHSSGNPAATDWSVSFTTATNMTVCGVTSIVEGTTCTIQQGLTAKTNYPYTVASNPQTHQCAAAGSGAIVTP